MQYGTEWFRNRRNRKSQSVWLMILLVMAGSRISQAGEAEPFSPDPIPLWPEGAPGALGAAEQDRPTIRILKPSGSDPSPTGTAVVICPGGGYGILAYDHEGYQVAKWFNRIGITAAVLRYRHAPQYHHPVPLNDAQRAVRYLRANAEKWGLSPNRIGIMGFSAGGHLASTASTHFDSGNDDAKDKIDRVSCRPDFTILGYPVISLKSDFGHKGSLRNLLGGDPAPALVESLSNETQVTSETPPAFLFHTSEDRGVPVQNSLVYYQALIEHGISAELHAYQNGPHGVGLGIGDPVLHTWKERLHDWLRTNGLLADVERTAIQGTIKVNGQPLRWGTITFVPVRSKDSTLENRLPRAAAMVSRGRYKIPKSRGPVLGKCRVIIHNLGSVEPKPTIPDVEQLDFPSLVEIVADQPELSFAFQEERTLP